MRIKSKSRNIKAFITAAYTSLVWIIYVFLNVCEDKKILSLLLIASLGCFYVLFQKVFAALDRVAAEWRDLKGKNRIFVFCMVAVITFGWMMIWYAAYYPGSFSYDSIVQYEQAVTGEYNDWHPALHTLLFFTLPLKITGQYSSIVFLQMVYFSLTMGYVAVTMCEMCGVKAVGISCLYIWFNPYVGYIMLYPWKDVGFALGGVLCLAIAVRLVWKKKRIALWELLVFGVLLACTTVFRHNAILYTGMLLLALLFNMEKRTWIKLAACFVAGLFVIEVPLYQMLHVSKPGSRVIETMGLPLTVIGNVAHETPERMDEELSAFVYAMGDSEKWENVYVTGNFNAVKWSGINTGVVQEEGYAGILRLMWKCFRLSPKASFRALFALTDMVYGYGLEGNVDAGICSNDYGIQYPEIRNETCKAWVEMYANAINSSIFRYVRTYGTALLALIICALNSLKFSSWHSWKRIFMLLPIFAYDYGTMLLLTGPDSRFFFITILVVPFMIGYTFFIKGEEDRWLTKK